MRLIVTTAAVDDVGTTYEADARATAEVPFDELDVLDVLEGLLLDEETVDALSLFEPPQAATVVSRAQIMAPRRTVSLIIATFPRR
jgi:hypothetical protein